MRTAQSTIRLHGAEVGINIGCKLGVLVLEGGVPQRKYRSIRIPAREYRRVCQKISAEQERNCAS